MKLVQAIEEASRRADPVEAIRSIKAGTGKSLSDARLTVTGKHEAHLRALLGGLYLRAGKINEGAAQLLRDLPDEPMAPVEAIVLDPHYYGLGGHLHKANTFYLDAAAKRGLAPAFVHPARDAPPIDGSLNIPALVAIATDRIFPLGIGAQETAALNKLFLRQFHQVLPRHPPRLLIAPTATFVFMEALAHYFASPKSETPTSLLLGIHDDFWAIGGADDPHFAPFDRAFELFAKQPNIRVLVVAETPAIADGFRRRTASAVEVAEGPFIPGLMATFGSKERNNGQTPVIGSLGRGIERRGSGLIPAIARLTLAARPDFSWRVQVNARQSDAVFSPDAEALIDELVAGGRFEVVAGRLPTEDYHALLHSIDIMVMPFDDSYEVRASGVTAECLSAASVMVAPERSTAAQFARRYGAGLITFSERSPEAIAAAVLTALQQLPELRARSLQAAGRLDESEHVRRVQQFIAAA